MPLLEGRNLRKTYKLSRRNEVRALRGVDVSIEAGELVSEAGLIGLLGGLLGLGLGAVVVSLANEAGRSSGMILFQLTPQTAIFAVLFSTILGVVAGIIPAANAARLDPVAALRYE